MAGPGIFFLCEFETIAANTATFNEAPFTLKVPVGLWRERTAAGDRMSMNIQRKDHASSFCIVRVRRDPKGRPEASYLAMVEAMADVPGCVRVCNDTSDGLAKMMSERAPPARQRLRDFASDNGMGTLPASMTSRQILQRAADTIGIDSFRRGKNAVVD